MKLIKSMGFVAVLNGEARQHETFFCNSIEMM